MKVVVFGGTGFIGSHVVAQLADSGHAVTAIVRKSSDTGFLRSLGVNVRAAEFQSLNEIADLIEGSEVVFNCLANPRHHQPMEAHREVEVYLTRMIAEGAAKASARRFVQLSTIQAYGSKVPDFPIDESLPQRPNYNLQRAYKERELTVLEVGDATGMETVIFQPASTIGARDTASFFSRLYGAYRAGQFPLFHGGKNRVSLIDTRDLARAMEWLATEGASGERYLAKGYDVSWLNIKEAFDQYHPGGAVEQKSTPPAWLAYFLASLIEWSTPYSKVPSLMRLGVAGLSRNTLIDDSHLRATGFTTLYSFDDSVQFAMKDLLAAS